MLLKMLREKKSCGRDHGRGIRLSHCGSRYRYVCGSAIFSGFSGFGEQCRNVNICLIHSKIMLYENKLKLYLLLN